MKRSRSFEAYNSSKNPKRCKLSHFLFAVAALYLLFLSIKSRHFRQIDRPQLTSAYRETLSRKLSSDPPPRPVEGRIARPFHWSGNLTALESMARDAWDLGTKAWDELERDQVNETLVNFGEKIESCPSEVSKIGKGVMILPCGLELGSSVTVIGMPESALEMHGSQFVVELQGLKAADGEDPPRILHLNPRLKGDWSQKPVVELNTCYRMNWGRPMRCIGLESKGDDDKVDGYNKCEKWEHSDTNELKESNTTSWLNRFIGRAKKPEMTWPFPFEEGKVFVMTLRAGMEGYHIYVGGRHVISFPYRVGFTLEDATGLAIKGGVHVHSAYATSLPKSHPRSSAHVLEMSERWRSLPLPASPIKMFIGILSATSHFAERMAVRKSWLQFPDIKLSRAVARFFVALGPRKEVNALLKKEAEYFGDIVILPFMDHYDLVVLKTLAICEYGVNNVTAKYVMKCDDDTFVRVDYVMRELDIHAENRSIYMGNLNVMHRPLRSGKWAVTYEEWPEEIYPPYANGPGYVISDDIASFIVSKHANQTLRMFKMEDVSMGMWVQEFKSPNKVQYLHSLQFCQYGCVENYYTSHYQSPRQMMCLWAKLLMGQAHCCNF